MQFFFQNNYFSKNQFGFIKVRSTAIQLLCIMDEWTTLLDSGGQVDVIYTDFAQAFDMVPHRRLLSKLKSYNMNQRLLMWIQDFLCNRKQSIGDNGEFWGTKWNSSGKHFGTIIIFNIYNWSSELCALQDVGSKIYLYADDAKIYKVINQITDQLDLQTVMNTVKTWSDERLLRLNIDKCKAVSYCLKTPLDAQYHIIDGNTSYNLEKLKFITGSIARSASLPVFNLLRGWFWGFLPRRGDMLHLHAKFHPQRFSNKGVGPQNWNFYSDLTEMWNINAPQERIACAIFAKFAEFVPHFRMH